MASTTEAERASGRITRRTMLGLSVVIAAAGCFGGPPKLSGEAIVYVVGPMSGDQAEGGQSMAGGARLRADEVNRAGGVLGGKRIIVRTLNDEADEEVAVDVAHQIEQSVKNGDTVLGVIGHYNSGPTAAALPIYRNLGLVVVTPSASNPDLTKGGITTFFRVCATDSTQGPTAAKYMFDQGWRTIALVHTDNAYALGLSSEFTAGLRGAGGQVAVDVRLKADAPTFADQIPMIKNASPQAVFFAGDFPDGITLVREMRKAGINVPILVSDANFVDQFIDELGATADGVLLSTITPDPRVVAPKEWFQAFQKLEQRNPGIDSTTGFSAMQVLLAGVQKANQPNGNAVANAIRSLDLKALVGPVKYDQHGDLVEQRVFIYKVENGVFRQVAPQG